MKSGGHGGRGCTGAGEHGEIYGLNPGSMQESDYDRCRVSSLESASSLECFDTLSEVSYS